MGPVEVTAGAVVLLVVVVGVWVVVAARRRGNRRRREEAERGTDDAAMRAEVIERLERAAAQWGGDADDAGPGGGSGTEVVEAQRAPLQPRTEPAENRLEAGPAFAPEIAPVPDEPARHGRPGRRIRVHWDPRA